MNETALLAVATQEIEQPTFGVVEQFLEIHEIAYQNGKPEVAGIAVDEAAQATVYFKVKDHVFYFAIYLDTGPEIQVSGAATEDFARVSFDAHSETLSLQQLRSFTSLIPTEFYEKGDEIITGRATINSIEFEPNPEPGATENKLKKLLTFLEQDAVGIKRLVAEAAGIIWVHTVFHNGNTMLGGIHLDKEDIQRLAALNLEINFDLFAEGNFFK
jgi:hypothetical protein